MKMTRYKNIEDPETSLLEKKEIDDEEMDKAIADAAERVIALLRQQLKDETRVDVDYLLTGSVNVQGWMMAEMHEIVDWVHSKVLEAHELDDYDVDYDISRSLTTTSWEDNRNRDYEVARQFVENVNAWSKNHKETSEQKTKKEKEKSRELGHNQK